MKAKWLRIAAIVAATIAVVYLGLWSLAQLTFGQNFHGYAGAEADDVPKTRQDCLLMADALARAQGWIILPGMGCRKVMVGGRLVYGSVGEPDMNQTRIPHYTGDTIVSPEVKVPEYSVDGGHAVVHFRFGGGTGEDGFGMDCAYRKVLGFWQGTGCRKTWIA